MFSKEGLQPIKKRKRTAAGRNAPSEVALDTSNVRHFPQTLRVKVSQRKGKEKGIKKGLFQK